MNIKEEIRKVLLKKKNEIFLNVLDKNINISYIDFYKNSSRVLNYFKKQKINPGSKITVQMDNSIEFLYVIFACLLGNYIVCPFDT